MDNELIDQLVKAWTTGNSLSQRQARDLAPASSYEAYKIQQAVGQELGWFRNGGIDFWKLGGTPRCPVAAPISSDFIYAISHQSPIRLDSSDEFNFTALEVEIAVRLGEPVLPGASLQAICNAVSEVCLAIEVCDLRAPNWESTMPTYRIADQQMNRGFLLMESQNEAWQTTFETLPELIAINSAPVSAGNDSHPMGHPLAGLKFLAELSVDIYGVPLQAGTTVATGAWTGMHRIHSGDTVAIETGQLGNLRLALDAGEPGARSIHFRSQSKHHSPYSMSS